jgi:glyoxylase-like metal-dependent hydrolase (beta-lactamase superfamily II)
MMALKAIPQVTQLSPRVIRILGCNPGPMTLQGTNTYLIGTGTNRVLLDSGESGNEGYISLLQKVLQDHKVSIERLMITHWHRDHVGGVADILREIKPKNCLVQKLKYSKHDDPSEKIEDIDLEEEVRVEGATLRFYHTPGHTEDHVVAVLEEENALFSGDCILGEGSAVFEDLKTYMASLEKILSLKPSLIYPGHGTEVTEPMAKIKEYIDHRNQREAQILSVLPSSESEGLTIEAIVKILYKDVPEQLHGAAGYNVGHHLEKLKQEQTIGSIEENGITRYFRHLRS